MWKIILVCSILATYLSNFYYDSVRQNLLLITELVTTVFIISLTLLDTTWANRKYKLYFLLTIFFSCIGDLNYGIQRLSHNENFELIADFLGELSFTISSFFMMLFMQSGISKRSPKVLEDLKIFVPLSILFILLNITYVLVPFFTRDAPIAIFYGITSAFFNVLISINLALGFLISVKTTNLKEFFVISGLMLFGVVSIAIGYNDSTGADPTYLVNHEAIWALCYLLILIGLLLAKNNTAFWSDSRSHSNSLRTNITYRIMLLNLVLVIVLVVIGAIKINNAFNVVLILYGFYGIWITGNLTALKFSQHIQSLIKLITGNNLIIYNSSGGSVLNKIPNKTTFFELNSILSAYNESIDFCNTKVKEISKYQADQKIAETTIQVASQVAHDIRSPLSALEMIILTLHELPEDKRIIIRNAVNRIRDIANSLSSKKEKLDASHEKHGSPTTQDTTLTSEARTATLLLPVLESMVTEKRIQYRNHLSIDIDFSQTKESYGLFANVQSNEFKRVISNLLNNAIESLTQHSGSVQVILTSTPNKEIEITITDTGCGIPTDILSKIGERGATFNKPTGSGLGLYHAKESIESWGGKLEVRSPTNTSKPNPGTQIIILLPMAEAPSWFVSQLTIKQGTRVVIFDDDQTIHQIWQGRLEHELPKNSRITTIHISTAHELKKYYQENFVNLDQCIYLMDYEILNEPESGLKLIEDLGIQKDSILVTSRYEEPHIRTQCARLGVKLIPKPMAGFVPIRCS